jgi:preprotein translocase subunit YajC
MDKNQSIILMIIVVLIAACIFLYFVFRPQENQEDVITDGTESVVDISDVSIEGGLQEDVSVQQDPIVSNIAESRSFNEMLPSNENNSSEARSPETGPGTIVAVIAFVTSMCIVGYWWYISNSAKKRSY